MTLTQKETMFLKDLKSQEELCIEKYSKGAATASDGNLKNLFTQLGQVEQTHLDSITQLLAGTVPTLSGGGQQAQVPTNATYTGVSHDQNKHNDCFLCSDLLAMEKHVSSIYDTSIFEFGDVGARNVLNHIQKEEQEHGEKIYAYMSLNGMYSA